MMAFDTTKLGTTEQDVTYCTTDGYALKMDVYYPTSVGPWPGVIFIHGGGWTEGDKAPLPVMPTASGFLVVSLNYRMYPAYRFPAMIEDVKCAIRFLRAHAADYNLAAERIAVIGHSAGGHLAALAGLADERAGWDVGPYREHSSRVQAVVEMSGPTDLTARFPEAVEELKGNVFGAEHFVSASPVTYVAADAPPFLIIHGDKDAVVPVEQAQRLHDALRKAGASSELVILQHAGHGFEPVDGLPTPAVEEAMALMFGFLMRRFADF
ncbi:MAG TPA: alpha/beta hydrolase [Anaerolineae bacterium]|nr:alpha/beta hydrolase [Anaerolineae bacterium]HQI85600.1 alpha/beta hydrolase [Anaerolineae bacterium]